MTGMGEAYGVDLKVPWLAGAVERDDDFFVIEAEFAEGDVRAVGPRADVVGLGGVRDGGRTLARKEGSKMTYVEGELLESGGGHGCGICRCRCGS